MSNTVVSKNTPSIPAIDFKISEKVLHYICELASTQPVPFIEKHMLKYGINTKKRMALFIASCFVQSAYFNRTKEVFNSSPSRLVNEYPVVGSLSVAEGLIKKGSKYTGNYIYANVNGNGDLDSGDGWNFKRRSPLQFYGRKHYELISMVSGLDCVNHPEVLEDVENGVVGAMIYWQSEGFNELADNLDFADTWQLRTADNENVESRNYSTNSSLMEVVSKLDNKNICLLDFGTFIEMGMLYM